MDTEARTHFYNWWNESIDTFNAIQNDAEVKSRVMKQPLITARLALIFQVMRWACGESHLQYVDICSVKSAISMINYFEECYEFITKQVANDSIEPQALEMLELLPEDFSTNEAIVAGQSVGIGKRMVQYNLVKLLELAIIKKRKLGKYSKIVNHEIY